MTRTTQNRLPDLTRFQLLEISSERVEWIEDLSVGPQQLWRRIFDVGIVVMALVQAAALAAVGYVLYAVVTAETSGSSTASSSGGSGEILSWALLNPLAAILLIGVVSIVLHEAGHAIAGTIEGHPPREVGFVLFTFLPNGAYVWLRDSESMSPRASLRVDAAGVFVNTVLAVASIGALGLTGISLNQGSLTSVQWVLAFTAALNIGVALVNALPIGGLDGSSYLTELWDLLRENDRVSSASAVVPVFGGDGR